jgi:hypothetical protein
VSKEKNIAFEILSKQIKQVQETMKNYFTTQSDYVSYKHFNELRNEVAQTREKIISMEKAVMDKLNILDKEQRNRFDVLSEQQIEGVKISYKQIIIVQAATVTAIFLTIFSILGQFLFHR